MIFRQASFPDLKGKTARFYLRNQTYGPMYSPPPGKDSIKLVVTFKLEECVGRGTHGVVYAATSRDTRFCIKIVYNASEFDNFFLPNLKADTPILPLLATGIVDVGEDRFVAILMQRADTTMFDLVTTLNDEERNKWALRTLRSSLKGIKILKTAGKSHRNITAVNVFGIDQSVMLADGSTVAKFDEEGYVKDIWNLASTINFIGPDARYVEISPGQTRRVPGLHPEVCNLVTEVREETISLDQAIEVVEKLSNELDQNHEPPSLLFYDTFWDKVADVPRPANSFIIAGENISFFPKKAGPPVRSGSQKAPGERIVSSECNTQPVLGKSEDKPITMATDPRQESIVPPSNFVSDVDAASALRSLVDSLQSEIVNEREDIELNGSADTSSSLSRASRNAQPTSSSHAAPRGKLIHPVDAQDNSFRQNSRQLRRERPKIDRPPPNDSVVPTGGGTGPSILGDFTSIKVERDDGGATNSAGTSQHGLLSAGYLPAPSNHGSTALIAGTLSFREQKNRIRRNREREMGQNSPRRKQPSACFQIKTEPLLISASRNLEELEDEEDGFDGVVSDEDPPSRSAVGRQVSSTASSNGDYSRENRPCDVSNRQKRNHRVKPHAAEALQVPPHPDPLEMDDDIAAESEVSAESRRARPYHTGEPVRQRHAKRRVAWEEEDESVVDAKPDPESLVAPKPRLPPAHLARAFASSKKSKRASAKPLIARQTHSSDDDSDYDHENTSRELSSNGNPHSKDEDDSPKKIGIRPVVVRKESSDSSESSSADSDSDSEDEHSVSSEVSEHESEDGVSVDSVVANRVGRLKADKLDAAIAIMDTIQSLIVALRYDSSEESLRSFALQSETQTRLAIQIGDAAAAPHDLLLKLQAGIDGFNDTWNSLKQHQEFLGATLRDRFEKDHTPATLRDTPARLLLQLFADLLELCFGKRAVQWNKKRTSLWLVINKEEHSVLKSKQIQMVRFKSKKRAKTLMFESSDIIHQLFDHLAERRSEQQDSEEGDAL